MRYDAHKAPDAEGWLELNEQDRIDQIIRPGGEGGTTPALGACINAVVNALADLGVKHVEMPATPERVWRAIQDARAK